MISTPWQNFILDAALITAWVAQGFLHTGNFRDWRTAVIGVCYWISAVSICGIMVGDFALSLGYTNEDYWFLERQYRVVNWRYGVVSGQVVIALVSRFSWR